MNLKNNIEKMYNEFYQEGENYWDGVGELFERGEQKGLEINNNEYASDDEGHMYENWKEDLIENFKIYNKEKIGIKNEEEYINLNNNVEELKDDLIKLNHELRDLKEIKLESEHPEDFQKIRKEIENKKKMIRIYENEIENKFSDFSEKDEDVENYEKIEFIENMFREIEKFEYESDILRKLKETNIKTTQFLQEKGEYQKRYEEITKYINKNPNENISFDTLEKFKAIEDLYESQFDVKHKYELNIRWKSLESINEDFQSSDKIKETFSNQFKITHFFSDKKNIKIVFENKSILNNLLKEKSLISKIFQNPEIIITLIKNSNDNSQILKNISESPNGMYTMKLMMENLKKNDPSQFSKEKKKESYLSKFIDKVKKLTGNNKKEIVTDSKQSPFEIIKMVYDNQTKQMETYNPHSEITTEHTQEENYSPSL